MAEFYSFSVNPETHLYIPGEQLNIPVEHYPITSEDEDGIKEPVDTSLISMPGDRGMYEELYNGPFDSPVEPPKVELELNAEIAERHRPSAERLADTIEKVNALGLLVVGSVGRAAIFKQLTGNPNLEFAARKPTEQPLAPSQCVFGIKVPRDVDVIGGEIPDIAAEHWQPHRADDGAFYNDSRKIIKDAGGAWWLERSYNGSVRATAIDPRIFEPVNGNTVNDIPCVTVRPATHAILFDGSCRPNDIAAQRLLLRYMPDSERALYHSLPFQHLRSLLRTH